MRFDYFNEAELEQMHGATVEILTRIGISTSSDRFKGLLLDNGCKEQGDRILFTEEVIEKALKTVPSNFNLYGRNGCDLVIEMGKQKAYTQTCVGTPSVIDLETEEKRDATLKDLDDFAKLADALENIHLISPVFPRDVPQEIIVTSETAAILRNSSTTAYMCRIIT